MFLASRIMISFSLSLQLIRGKWEQTFLSLNSSNKYFLHKASQRIRQPLYQLGLNLSSQFILMTSQLSELQKTRQSLCQLGLNMSFQFILMTSQVVSIAENKTSTVSIRVKSDYSVYFDDVLGCKYCREQDKHCVNQG